LVKLYIVRGKIKYVIFRGIQHVLLCHVTDLRTVVNYNKYITSCYVMLLTHVLSPTTKNYVSFFNIYYLFRSVVYPQALKYSNLTAAIKSMYILILRDLTILQVMTKLIKFNVVDVSSVSILI
jgi:hypothetical protein